MVSEDDNVLPDMTVEHSGSNESQKSSPRKSPGRREKKNFVNSERSGESSHSSGLIHPSRLRRGIAHRAQHNSDGTLEYDGGSFKVVRPLRADIVYAVSCLIKATLCSILFCLFMEKPVEILLLKLLVDIHVL